MGCKFTLAVILPLVCSCVASAQDPVGAIEGQISDMSKARGAAHIKVENLATGLERETVAATDGLLRVPLLPVGEYRVQIDAPHFATFIQRPVTVNISQSVRLAVTLSLSQVSDSVTVTVDAPAVDTSTNVLGAVVTGRQILDLPFNGRNHTQLGLLQP